MTTHLPIATQFCSAEIELFDGLSFFVDGNSKITRENGSYSHPKPNAFSLPAASVPVTDPIGEVALPQPCPRSTETCRSSCYVKGLAQHAPDLYARYQQNARVLAYCLRDNKAFYHSALKLSTWADDNAAHGFRWHVSGDVWGKRHAHWIAETCALADGVPFWIYTRTLEAVPELVKARNLAVNVSADKDNFEHARAVADAFGLTLCYLITSHDDPNLARLPEGSVLFPDYPLRTRTERDTGHAWWQALAPEFKRMICPTDQFGQSESHRCGPCTKCF
jgi:hypothetical protein